MNTMRLLSLLALTYFLAACSGHPGAGNWQSTNENRPNFVKEFVKLEVGYEGRTDIFGETPFITEDGNGAIRRCFWRGVDAQTIVMTCVQAANTDIEESYQLRVGADNKVAELIKDEVVVGRFVREK
ncbi:MAG: hypothetical protein ABFS08_06795 [Pseudomonadota bacterium]